jgi:hypothetical protein
MRRMDNLDNGEGWTVTKRVLVRDKKDPYVPPPEIEYGSFASRWMTRSGMQLWEMPHGIVKQACPFCDHGRSFLTAEVINIDGGEMIYASYKCDNCSESFTTTEIDTINYAPHTEKRRRRKLIIDTIKSIFKLKTKTNGRNSK